MVCEPTLCVGSFFIILMQFTLKKHIAIHKFEETILVGSGVNVVRFPKNDAVYNVLETLYSEGVDEVAISDSSVLKALYENDYLEEVCSKNISDLEIRNQLYLDFLNLPFPKDYLEKKILIFGAGGGGSIICYLLSQWGFKNVFILDDDIVEESDISKTLIFQKEDCGKKKIQVLKEKILENFSLRITPLEKKIKSKQELNDTILNTCPDFIVYAMDPQPIFKIYLNEICFDKNIPFIIGAYSYQHVRIGPLCSPNETSCLLAMESFLDKVGSSMIRNKQLFKQYYTHPSVAFNIQILGGMIFKEILFFLTKNMDQVISLGKVITLNPLNLKASSLELECQNCKICQE